MVLLTIITCSKNWTVEINLHQYASYHWSLQEPITSCGFLVPFLQREMNIHGALS